MDVTTAVAFAKELEGELIAEVARARGERLLLKSLNGAKLEERLAERRAFEDRANDLQRRLRLAIRAAALGAGLRASEPQAVSGDAAEKIGSELLEQLAEKIPEGRELRDLVASIRGLAQELSKANQLNRFLAERALACTKAYLRALAPRPAAYDRRGVESSPASALSSISRRA